MKNVKWDMEMIRVFSTLTALKAGNEEKHPYS